MQSDVEWERVMSAGLGKKCLGSALIVNSIRACNSEHSPRHFYNYQKNTCMIKYS